MEMSFSLERAARHAMRVEVVSRWLVDALVMVLPLPLPLNVNLIGKSRILRELSGLLIVKLIVFGVLGSFVCFNFVNFIPVCR